MKLNANGFVRLRTLQTSQINKRDILIMPCKAEIYRAEHKDKGDNSCRCGYCFFNKKPDFHGCPNHSVHCAEVLKIENSLCTLQSIDGELTFITKTATIKCCCGKIYTVANYDDNLSMKHLASIHKETK